MLDRNTNELIKVTNQERTTADKNVKRKTEGG